MSLRLGSDLEPEGLRPSTPTYLHYRVPYNNPPITRYSDVPEHPGYSVSWLESSGLKKDRRGSRRLPYYVRHTHCPGHVSLKFPHSLDYNTRVPFLPLWFGPVTDLTPPLFTHISPLLYSNQRRDQSRKYMTEPPYWHQPRTEVPIGSPKIFEGVPVRELPITTTNPSTDLPPLRISCGPLSSVVGVPSGRSTVPDIKSTT